MSIFTEKLLLRKTDVLKTFDFLSLKKLSPGKFLGSSDSREYHWILKLHVAT